MLRSNLLRKYLILAAIASLLSTSLSPNFCGNIGSGKQTNNSMPDDSRLDVGYIYNITKALSYIVYTEYDEKNDEIARGRAFGTVGERKAAEILEENLSDLGLWAWKENIVNTPELPNIASTFWVNDYKIVIKNVSSGTSKTVDGYISPTWKGLRGSPNKIDYNFSFNDLKFKVKPKYSLPFGKILRGVSSQDDYVYIMEDDSFNPNITYPIKKLFDRLLGPYSNLDLFYGYVKLTSSLATWYKDYPHCQGLVRYDFTDDTYNMVKSDLWNLPVIFINGTIGKEIMSDIDNYRIDFYLNQTYKKSVESYNVIGQLNGTDTSKIVLVDCLYDGMWNQATADSAIGMAIVLGIAKWFKDNNITPKYTIRFIGFGGEENGGKGAKYYQAVHKNENINYVIDMNQLGFSQKYPELYLDIMSNNARFLNNIFEIAKQSNYSERTGYAGIRKFYMPQGAPSDDQFFAKSQQNCKTVCFLKGITWIFHHRDGLNHTEGDSIKYFDWTDVGVTGEMVLNVTKYLTVDPLNQFK